MEDEEDKEDVDGDKEVQLVVMLVVVLERRMKTGITG